MRVNGDTSEEKQLPCYHRPGATRRPNAVGANLPVEMSKKRRLRMKPSDVNPDRENALS